MKRSVLLFVSLLAMAGKLSAQAIEKTIEERLQAFLIAYKAPVAKIGECKLDSFYLDHQHRKLTVYASENLGYQPIRQEVIDDLYKGMKEVLPGPVNYYDLQVIAGKRDIEELIPNYYRKKTDKARLLTNINDKGEPWVTRTSRPYEVTRGLAGRHISLWQSHGNYYINKLDRWGWQRPRLYCTSEDQLTQSFILPYLIPMLENAGAVVYTPRERDTQHHEVIVDNDGKSSLYIEEESRKAKWINTANAGFAHTKNIYQDGDNPFTAGSARFARTERKKEKAFAQWVPDIPEKGKYAVYVSYQTLPNSVSDARYLVFHNGGVTEFTVNQQIGGGTWVYLGTFEFDKGQNDYGMVVLSNQSNQHGVVCADAVRFGGGMGNIARGDKLSGLPRYLEAARYSAQWAGMPYDVYGGRKGANDYADDLNVRSKTINYIAGGSPFNPTEEGLGVPFEMNMALHTDAGFTDNDTLIGSLGVYTTNFNDGKLHAGTDRLASRDLTDMLLSQLDFDIPATCKAIWTRRSMWDRNYSETRLPSVAGTIIELLSHQNFADMRLAHNPHFKFTVGRSLYKGILKYLCSQHNEAYIVQPLPVNQFAIEFGEKKNTVTLSWQAVNDPLEPTAKADGYIVYTRIGRGGWDNGVRVKENSYTMNIEPGIITSYKVTAINRGGESFPSEILSAYKAKREKARVLIVNGFDRLSGPAVINTPTETGFDLIGEPGVPYQYDISYCGRQTNFDRTQAGKSLGVSTDEYEGMELAGNNFDYPFVHGKAMQTVKGISFTSCSDEAVENGVINLRNYNMVDYILGMEKTDVDYAPLQGDGYKSFTQAMQQQLMAYTRAGGALMVSGAFVGSDMNNNENDRTFTSEVLKYRFDHSLNAADTLQIHVQGLGQDFTMQRRLNPVQYAVSAPDCISPTGKAFTAMAYSEGFGAATAYKGNDYRTFILAFPLEAVEGEDKRASIMASALQFLLEEK